MISAGISNRLTRPGSSAHLFDSDSVPNDSPGSLLVF